MNIRAARLLRTALVTLSAATLLLAATPGASADTWSGGVSLTAAPTIVDANSPSSLLTATLTQPLSDGLEISIYAESGAKLLCQWTSSISTFGVWVTPEASTVGHYTVYVAEGCPDFGPPVGDVRAQAEIEVTNNGYTGTMSMTGTPTTTTANSPSSRLDIHLSKPRVDPYKVSVYDANGTQVLCDWRTNGSEFAVNVTPGAFEARTYTAYVAKSCPSDQVPTLDVRAHQSITVTNTGWDGTLTVTMSKTQTDANDPNNIATVDLSKPLASPFRASLYNSSGAKIACWWTPGQTTFNAWAIPATMTTETFTAYVGLDCPEMAAPLYASATAEATVTNVGWNGTLTLTGNGAIPNPLLNVRTSKPLAAVCEAVYDETGNMLQGWSSGDSHDVWTTAGHTYHVFIAAACPSIGFPTNNIVQWASFNVGLTGLVTTTLNGVDIDQLAAILDAMGPTTVDSLLLMLPGTHFEYATTTDQYLKYQLAKAAGATTRAAIIAAASASTGVSAGRWLALAWSWVHDKPAPPDPPTTPQPTPNDPVDPNPTPSNATPTYEDWLTADLMRRNDELTAQQARIQSRTCIRQTTWAISLSALPATINGKYPCEALDLYFPAMDYAATTQHNADAIHAIPRGAS